MRLFFFILVFSGIHFSTLLAQSAYLPFDRDYYHLLERYEIKNGEFNPSFHTGTKPYRRDKVAEFLIEYRKETFNLTKIDSFNLDYLRQDSWEFYENKAPVSKINRGKRFYQTPSDFYFFRNETFDVHVNPVIYFQGGIESQEPVGRFRNSRGIALRGSIDRKIGFYSFFTTTDVVFPSWVRDYARHKGAVPGEGFWKRYGDSGYSYFSAMGYINFQATEHIQFQMGHDRNFIGEGYRSLVLSDFSNPYPFFKINTKIWKINFTNIWGQMNADIITDRGFPTDGRYPQKWFTFHRLGMNFGKRLNVGLFESVMANHFDLNYLNPIIFNRWVEHQLGSPDKVMVGTDFKWNFAVRMQLYGQFVLDEFVFDEFFGTTGKGSSRNKHGVQLGCKYVDVAGINNLDLQMEYNQARPYMYQEKFNHQSFSNYRMPLTHPMGANFRELIAKISYQPLTRLILRGTMLVQNFGSDPTEEANFGGDILKNRVGSSTGLFGNFIGQGVSQKIFMGSFQCSYMLKHNLFLDFSQTLRSMKSETDIEDLNNSFGQLSLRLNIGRFDHHF
ncbi:MAG: hypothetical protein WDZ72_07950 [Cyclobacteriaceae bacterium]